jgi:hypothetical protein
MWKRAEEYFSEMNKKYPVCQYPLNEQELPKVMEKNGFKNISTNYISINLTPDSYETNKNLALDFINDVYDSMIDDIKYLKDYIPDVYSIYSKEELIHWINEIEIKRKERIRKYKNGEKLWETNVSIIMIVKGIKKIKPAHNKR